MTQIPVCSRVLWNHQYRILSRLVLPYPRPPSIWGGTLSMGPLIWGLAFLMLFCKAPVVDGIDPNTVAAAVCVKALLVDSIMLPFSSSCAIEDGFIPVVTEGDESALHKAMYLVHKNRGDYVALLFYASWCPFSKDCRSNFNVLQLSFPRIHHFAFEESTMRPSTLSRYGVHGFPTLFLLNATLRIRYHGPRTINLLTAFYVNVTGSTPIPINPESLDRSKKLICNWDAKGAEDLQNCPFSWARSPEKLLQQDTYMLLAVIFVVIRLLCTVLPKILACCSCAWTGRIDNPSLLSLFQAFLERSMHACAALNPWHPNGLQGRAKNAHVWVSQSLGSVSMGEGERT